MRAILKRGSSDEEMVKVTNSRKKKQKTTGNDKEAGDLILSNRRLQLKYETNENYQLNGTELLEYNFREIMCRIFCCIFHDIIWKVQIQIRSKL